MTRTVRLNAPWWRAIAALGVASGLCASAAVAASPPLAGTTWQLVAIQSMDDTQGRTVVPQPERFTLAFATDGSVALRLDCNRGAGRYQAAQASAAPPSGQLSFEGLAVTRALCLPPGLDARVTRDLAHVRSYLLEHGRLFLSLMADGGILEWTPVARANAVVHPDQDRRVVPVSLMPGQTTVVMRGRIRGREYIDHQITARAGQRLRLRFESSHRANSFILLPPGSSGEAMASGDLLSNRYEGALPTDGVYTVRVFLMRAAARRHESSQFELGLSLTGEVPQHGTPPHAPHPAHQPTH
jgi:heat shock protein HslJ